jgi:hypothetical protein
VVDAEAAVDAFTGAVVVVPWAFALPWVFDLADAPSRSIVTALLEPALVLAVVLWLTCWAMATLLAPTNKAAVKRLMRICSSFAK